MSVDALIWVGHDDIGAFFIRYAREGERSDSLCRFELEPFLIPTALFQSDPSGSRQV